MVALFKIEPTGTVFYSYPMSEQTKVAEWCFETFVDPNDECFNGEEEDFDIAAFLESK